MFRKITLAAVLAATAITMTIPASASGLPGDGHYPYPASYQDQNHVYTTNRSEW